MTSTPVRCPGEGDSAAEMFEAMGKYNEELVKAGIMLAGDGLKPSKFGKRIHFSGAKRSVTDGPFAEAKELVAGFWIWQVKHSAGVER
ncbi:MAG TPA: YciI family protein [Gemmatimonadales bacterium]|nr:YciI family protein [Gemmatimonadales bacterium]